MENNTITPSKYDGTYWGLLGKTVLAIIISVASLGIAFPWAFTLVHRWVVSKMSLNGKKLRFDGRGGQLFGVWITMYAIMGAITIAIIVLIFLIALTLEFDSHWEFSHLDWAPWALFIIPLGLLWIAGAFFLGFWFDLKLNQVAVAGIHREESDANETSNFSAGYWEFIGNNILLGLRLLVTVGIGLPWALRKYASWFTSKTEIDNAKLTYTAMPSFLKSWIPYWIGIVIIALSLG